MTEHFADKELTCKCGCGKAAMDERFMARLEQLRLAFGAPMIVTSAYRCPFYNHKVSNTGHQGPHTTGMAVDIAISGPEAYTLVLLAMQLGFSGIGIRQSGPHAGRFVHVDDLPVASWPRPRIWSY
ncbi:MAG: YcbK family protein [Thermodesulfobacteriota bacterium]